MHLLYNNQRIPSLSESEAATRGVQNKCVLKNLQKSQENTCARVSFSIKLQASDLQLYQKRESGTCVFRWIFWNFQEHLILQKTSGAHFCLNFRRTFRGVFEPCQTSKMERFVKIVSNFAVNYFRKTLHVRCFTGFCMHFWHFGGLKLR